MRKLPPARRAQILAALVEGSSVNATARMVGVSKITVLRLLADVGAFCAAFHDRTVRGVQVAQVQADEVWSYCGCKEKARKAGAQGHGDAWVWVGIDRDTKLVLSYHVGKRDARDAERFMHDLAGRIEGRTQINTDALAAYRWAVASAFGQRADYAAVVKTFGKVPGEEGRYSPPVCTGCEKRRRMGTPDLEAASTSHVERQNLTVRMGSRRFTRLTNGFSKRLENHEAALHLHYWYFNFARKHMTLKTTPAVAAGLADRAYTLLDLVGMLETAEALQGSRLTGYLPAATSK